MHNYNPADSHEESTFYRPVNFRRMRVNERGERKGTYERGEHKAILTDRSIIVPGPPKEVNAVRWIFRAFAEQGLGETAIARKLNQKGVKTFRGYPWSGEAIRLLLTNERYVGESVWNKASTKLKGSYVQNPSDSWIRNSNFCEPIVSRKLFDAAQERRRGRRAKFMKSNMIAELRTIYEQRGHLSRKIIDETDGISCSRVYLTRFGGMEAAFEQVGFTLKQDRSFVAADKRLEELRPAIVESIMVQIEKVGGIVERDSQTGNLKINEEIVASVVLVRCDKAHSSNPRWHIRCDKDGGSNLTIAVRMDQENRTTLDYYLLPTSELGVHQFYLSERNDPSVDSFRFNNLEALAGMVTPVVFTG